MTRAIRQARSELGYLAHARYLTVLAVIMAAGVTLAFVGSLSHARATHQNFLDEVAAYEARGITLADALASPVVVTRAGGQETIDNPLKYDFLEVGKAVSAVQGSGMISTALDFTTFLVVPLIFLLLGAYSANFDRRTRTIAQRAARERWTWVTAGKMAALVVIALSTALLIAGIGALLGWVGSSLVASATTGIDYPLVFPERQTPLILQVLTTATVAVFFAVVGYAMGYLTRSYSWPIAVSAAALFALPFVAFWDPRNLLAVVGSQVYDFWGQFRLRPPLDVPVGVSAALLLVYLGVALAVVVVSARAPRLR